MKVKNGQRRKKKLEWLNNNFTYQQINFKNTIAREKPRALLFLLTFPAYFIQLSKLLDENGQNTPI